MNKVLKTLSINKKTADNWHKQGILKRNIVVVKSFTLLLVSWVYFAKKDVLKQFYQLISGLKLRIKRINLND